jgi:hypothetical protein
MDIVSFVHALYNGIEGVVVMAGQFDWYRQKSQALENQILTENSRKRKPVRKDRTSFVSTIVIILVIIAVLVLLNYAEII